jgi:predicted esterase
LILKRLIRLAHLAVVLAACACATPMGTGGTDMVLGAPGQHVETTVYKSRTLSSSPVLVVVLHGDAPMLRPAYHDEFANHLARSTDNVLAAALLRPGYADPFGRRSDPQSGPHIGDNYTPAVTAQIDAAIHELQQRYHPARTVLVGHSGGAAVIANLIEADHAIANAALLVSCPCDLAAWRARMSRFGGRRPHADSTSPLEHAADLPKDIPIVVMVGSNDHTVGVANSQSFYAGAKAAGANVTLQVVKGSGHMMLGDATPLKVAADLARAP